MLGLEPMSLPDPEDVRFILGDTKITQWSNIETLFTFSLFGGNGWFLEPGTDRRIEAPSDIRVGGSFNCPSHAVPFVVDQFERWSDNEVPLVWMQPKSDQFVYFLDRTTGVVLVVVPSSVN